MTMREHPNLYELVLREEPADGQAGELLAWCDAADDVAVAYETWRSAEPRDRGLAHAAYVAALDREQAASAVLAAAAVLARAA